MTDETTMAPEAMAPEQAPVQEWVPTPQANPEEEVIGQIIQMISGLWAESQRQLMWFLQQEFSNIIWEEKKEKDESPAEQDRKAEEMSEMF